MNKTAPKAANIDTIDYHIQIENTGAHLIRVAIIVAQPSEYITLKMPKWIPGSYKIRDYAKHVQQFSAFNAANEALVWKKLDSDTWRIKTHQQATQIVYLVYAYDLSVRGAYVDDERLFFNPCCVCMGVEGKTHIPHKLTITIPDKWALFTQLDKLNGDDKLTPQSHATNPHAPSAIVDKTHHYVAEHYDILIDSPVECAATSIQTTFTVDKISHHLQFTGWLSEQYDIDRLANYLHAICQVQITLFGDSPLTKNYHFMTYVEPNVYGGLEHLHSTALMASPDMILKKDEPLTEPTINFLGLCSHEYFHLWHVKRLRPTDYLTYDLSKEQNSEMLWLFEGFTSYYDELMLRRANVIDKQQFLNRQAKNLSNVLATPGRHHQSIAESSFDAWTKLYQADKNAKNHMVSYYAKGAVFALYLDLWLRENSQNQHSLDDLMRLLWKYHEKHQSGVDEAIVFKLCNELIPENKSQALAEVFATGIHGTKDLPIDQQLMPFGIDYKQQAPSNTQGQTHTSDPGFTLKNQHNQWHVQFLEANSQAAHTGLSIDDEIIAIDEQHISTQDLQQLLFFNQPQTQLTLTCHRRGRVFKKPITLMPASKNKVEMTIDTLTPLGENWLAHWLSPAND